MTEIQLSFHPNLLPLIRDGKKIVTTRREKHGEVNDTFVIENTEFKIREIHESFLGSIRDHIYRLEGFPSPVAFQETWEYLYDTPFNEDLRVFSHWFSPVKRVW